MNKQELIRIVTEKLGASNSEEKIAFDTFLQKVAESLDENRTLRIPEIGIFQLKKREVVKSSGLFTNENFVLIFVPLKYTPQERNVILVFNTTIKTEKELDQNESVFSLSVGKPLIPLSGANRRDFIVQSSYIMLLKKFEEKTDSLIESGVELLDFKIDTKSLPRHDESLEIMLEEIEKEDEKISESEHVAWDFGIGSDIIDSFKNKIPSSESISLQKEELPLQSTDDFLKNIDLEKIKEEFELDGNVNIKEDEDLKSDELIIDGQEIKLSEDFVNSDPFIEDSEELNENSNIFDEGSDLLNIKSDFLESADESENMSSEKDDLIFKNLIDLTEVEMKSRIDSGILDDNVELSDDIKEFNLDEITTNEGDNIGDLLSDDSEMELNTNESLSEHEDESPVETANEEKDNDVIQEEELEEQSVIENKILGETLEDFKVKEKFSLVFWIVLAAFLLISTGGIYYFFFYNNSGSVSIAENKPVEKQIIERSDEIPVTFIPNENREESAEENVSANKDKPEEIVKSETAPVNKPSEVNTGSNGESLFRQDDKNNLVKEFIFSNDNKFTIQLSSWKTKSVAEKETRRLKGAGHDAYISTYDSKAGIRWYRVRIGEYATLSEAENYLKNM